MKKRILRHLEWMDKYLEIMQNESLDSLEKTMKKHMTEIYFFMHERFIHLVVTVLFALGTFMTIFTYLLSENPVLLALAFLMIILLVPYVNHYYLLENGVQKMYVQYDELLAEIDRRNSHRGKRKQESRGENRRDDRGESRKENREANIHQNTKKKNYHNRQQIKNEKAE